MGTDQTPEVAPTRRHGIGHAWWQLLVVWLLTRIALGLPFYLDTSWAAGDVSYYYRQVSALHETGLAGTLVEYPTPVVWILQLPYLLGGGTETGYMVAFVSMMAVLDLAMLALLWFAAGRRHSLAAVVWLLFGACVGWLSYVRFDMIPAVLVGAALVLFWRRPGLAGGLLGLGAAIKLWPALLFPALLSARTTLAKGLPGAARRARRKGSRPSEVSHPTRGALTLGFVIVGCGLAVISLIAAGLPRLMSPLTWQSDRGLQIESVWASPLMLLHALHPDRWRVTLSTYNAYEIFGPGVTTWLSLSSIATIVGLLVIIAALGGAFALRTPPPWALTMLGLLIVLIMIITNKTLSPQYVTWLGGPLAVLFLAADTRGRRRQAAALSVTGLIIAVLTQLIFPLNYSSVIGADGHSLRGALLLGARNLLLVGCTVWVAIAYARTIIQTLRADRATESGSSNGNAARKARAVRGADASDADTAVRSA